METNNCCKPDNKKEKKGFLSGLMYGLLPHAFCIAFILFSVIGTAAGMSVVGKFLLIPYFFNILIALSLAIATISATIYLKRLDSLSLAGIKAKWKYLTLLYSTTALVNILMFFVLFPAIANISGKLPEAQASANLSVCTLKVDIPCSGHAPLIINGLKKSAGVTSVKFTMPNLFEIGYDSQKTSLAKISSLDIFDSFKAKVQ